MKSATAWRRGVKGPDDERMVILVQSRDMFALYEEVFRPKFAFQMANGSYGKLDVCKTIDKI